MSGHATSSSSPVQIIHQTHNSSADFLAVTLPELSRQERSSNIVYAPALKLLKQDTGLSFSDKDDLWNFLKSSCEGNPNKSGSRWFTIWSRDRSSQPFTLDLVLSCTRGVMGDYPIFLWSPLAQISATSFESRMTKLVDEFSSCVPPKRVFAVFGRRSLVLAFQRRWTAMTGHQIHEDPYYEAFYSYCTRDTFVDRPWSRAQGHEIRLATMDDLHSVGRLCKEFAVEAIHYPLDQTGGEKEAREFISKGQMWVYNINGECSTICAVTRSSFDVAGITKVHTTENHRKKGCAERLVRYVTRRLLHEDDMKFVTLYVGCKNNARHIYNRVGFAGLNDGDRPDGVEDALELGFKDTEKGYW